MTITYDASWSELWTGTTQKRGELCGINARWLRYRRPCRSIVDLPTGRCPFGSRAITVTDFIEWILLVVLFFGATFAARMLEACTHVAANVCRRFWPQMGPRAISHLGGALFLCLMLGVPILAVLWGFAHERIEAAMSAATE
jgi:hypothetical protein